MLNGLTEKCSLRKKLQFHIIGTLLLYDYVFHFRRNPSSTYIYIYTLHVGHCSWTRKIRFESIPCYNYTYYTYYNQYSLAGHLFVNLLKANLLGTYSSCIRLKCISWIYHCHSSAPTHLNRICIPLQTKYNLYADDGFYDPTETSVFTFPWKLIHYWPLLAEGGA